MRLGQLARQLNINTSDIVSLLNEHDITINDHPNVKIEGEPEQIVLGKFGQEKKPEKAETEITVDLQVIEESAPTTELLESPLTEEEPITFEEEQIAAVAEIEPSIPQEEESKEMIEPQELNMPDAPEENHENLETSIELVTEETNESNLNIDEDEVIRAPKISLEGLKVVGKIDLPEPKIKEQPTKENDDFKPKRKSKHYRSDQTEEEREARRIRNKEIKERRLQKEKEREQQEREERERKAKEEFYRKKLVTEKAQKNKKAKRKDSQKEVKQILKSENKTAFGKFWQWLNT